MMNGRSFVFLAILLALTGAACGGAPSADGLRGSFAEQLASNRFVKELQRSGDDLRFSGPGANGENAAAWRVQIVSVSVEPNDDPAHPYKGVVKSSWYANDREVVPAGRDSNLPLELTSNGLAQECWALWDKASGRWSWE